MKDDIVVSNQSMDLTSVELRKVLQHLAPDAKVTETNKKYFPYYCSWHNQLAEPSTGKPRSGRWFDSRRSIARFFTYLPQNMADNAIVKILFDIETTTKAEQAEMGI